MKFWTPSHLVARSYCWAALPMADSPRIESRLRAILAPSLRRIALSSRRERTVALIASTALALTLGTLRPVGTRRNVATPSIAFAVEPSSPPHKEAVDKTPRFLIDTISENPRWTRVLLNQMGTVELVGVSLRHDETPNLTLIGKPDPITGAPIDKDSAKWILSRSWKPDGMSFSQPLYPVGHPFTHGGVPPKRLLEFALRFRSRSDIELHADGEGCSSSGFLGTVDGKPYGGFQVNDRIWRDDVVVPRSQKTFPARFLITGGAYPWHEDFALFGMGDSGGTYARYIGGQTTRLALIGPFVNAEGQNGFALTNSTLRNCDTRVVAIDRQGHEVNAVTETSSDGGGYTQTTVLFDQKALPLKEIAAIRFEARPYQTIDFGNVALYPAKVSR